MTRDLREKCEKFFEGMPPMDQNEAVIRLESFAREIRNEALEEAAIEVEAYSHWLRTNKYETTWTAIRQFADKFRVLKEST